MSNSLLAFFLIVFLVFGWVWLVSLRRLQTVEIARIFEPSTYNLLIFSFTSLIGILTILFFGDIEHFNKVVNTYGSRELSISLFLVVVIILLMLSFVSRWNISYNLPKVQILHPLKNKDLLVLFLMMIVLTYAIFDRVQAFAVIFTAADQFEVMQERKLFGSNWISFFLNKLVVQGILWVVFLNILLRRNITYNSSFLRNLMIWTIILLYILYSIASLQKLTPIYFIVSAFAAMYYHRTFSVIKFFRAGILLFILMFGIYYLLVKNIDLTYMLSPFQQGLVGRIFISEISSLYPHFELFGNRVPHIGFASISSTLSSLMDIPDLPRSGETVMSTVNPHWVRMGIGGTYNTLFIGEAYANFGWFGVWISIIWVPIYFLLLVTYIRKFCPQYSAALLIYCSLNVSVMAGFNDFIYNPFLILLLIIFTDYKIIFGGRSYKNLSYS